MSVTRFAELSENSEVFGHQILTGKTDRSDGLVIVPIKIRFDET